MKFINIELSRRGLACREKLIDLHPWASKVRFARTGGEANSIAIRIAESSNW